MQLLVQLIRTDPEGVAPDREASVSHQTSLESGSVRIDDWKDKCTPNGDLGWGRWCECILLAVGALLHLNKMVASPCNDPN